MTAAIFGLLARHLLTGVGAVLVTRGMDPTSAESIVGVIATIGGLAWSYIQKHRAQQ